MAEKKEDQLRLPPHSVEAEQAVIGSSLVSNDIFDDISTIVNSNKFYDHINAYYIPTKIIKQ